MATLFETETQGTDFHPLGNGVAVKLQKNYVEVWRNGGFLFKRDLDYRERTPQLRLLVVELHCDHRAQKTKLGSTFGIKSRQTIDIWIASYQKYGVTGLENSTKNQGNKHRAQGNKSKQLREARAGQGQGAAPLQYSLEDLQVPDIKGGDITDGPYGRAAAKKPNRYAGAFAVLILLSGEYRWFNWVIGYFGQGYKIMQVFVLMFAKNIRSVEQLKNVRLREAGAILGIEKIPSLPQVWGMFYQACTKGLSRRLTDAFFLWQIARGGVGHRFWFTDGHVLPYTGKAKMHQVYNTKKREPEPGCVNFVSCDVSGKVVDFQIKEGGQGLRGQILGLHQKWQALFRPEDYPVHVFDREGYGHDFFYGLIQAGCPFVTWEKHANSEELYNIPAGDFVEKITVNSTEYHFLEVPKKFTPKATDKHQHTFELRRFYILNTANQKRTSALAFGGQAQLTGQDCVYAILNRWGASENTFKHSASRHPIAYRPGFKLLKSERQTIANPETKRIEKEIKALNGQYVKACKKLAKTEKKQNKSGTARANNAYSKLKATVKWLEEQKRGLAQKKTALPERIDVTGLQDYKCFEKHDNEGKNLFDWTGALVWNARKQAVEMLRQLYPFENDVVDLFYAIINCQGTLQISATEVKVTLEPLQQSSRRAAQIDFCRKLTQMGAKTPNNQAMVIQVQTQN